ncbi:MAG: hypothetical protein Q7V57_16155 [Actinomycetota bacterium]|nr:hypothetical protein [Actinomycetota bacterium]
MAWWSRSIQSAVAGDDIAALIDEYQAGTSLSEASDRLMVAIAERFLDGRLSYGDADQAANVWWALMCRPGHHQTQPIPTLAHAIFDAFDQGEYTHGDHLDPVEQYTIPLLRSALDEPITRGGD